MRRLLRGFEMPSAIVRRVVRRFVPAREIVCRSRLVRTLEPTLLPPGVTEIVWDGRDEGGHSVSAGVYFLRWRNDDGAGARPIVVVK